MPISSGNLASRRRLTWVSSSLAWNAACPLNVLFPGQKTSASRHHGTYRWPEPTPLPPPGIPCQPATAATRRCRYRGKGRDPAVQRGKRLRGHHSRLYTHVEPTHLHPPVIEHTRVGAQLLAETAGVSHTVLATALAEALLLAGRIEFFDLRQADDADATFVRALQAAGEADDAPLRSAILAHAAFVPALTTAVNTSPIRATVASMLTSGHRQQAARRSHFWSHSPGSEDVRRSPALTSLSKSQAMLI